MEFFSENLQSESSPSNLDVSKLSQDQLNKIAYNTWLTYASNFITERERLSKLSNINIEEEEALVRAKEVMKHAASLETVHSEALKSVRGAGDVGSSVLKEVKDLRDFISQISDSVKNINDIAERVHVLSLNAAIEAARAGERGKGFAVVSSEIRSLAGSTAQRVDEISEFIRQSASTVERVVEGIQSTVSTVTGTHHQLGSATEYIKSAENLAVKVRDEIKKSHMIRLIDNVRADHASLRVNVYQAILKGESLSEDKIPNSHNCPLGRWYRENKGANAFSDLTIYQQLERPHEEFHNCIDRLRQAINQDNAAEITKNIEDLETANNQISNILMDVIKSIE